MLKATSISKYRRPSGWILVYAVTGTAAEVEEYTNIMSAGVNKTPDQWSKTPTGAPLFYLPEMNLLREGKRAKPQYNLVKSFDNTRFFIDTTNEDNARNARVMAAAELEEGKLLAQIGLGLLTVGNRQPAAAPAIIPAQPAPAHADIADDIADDVEGGEGVESLNDEQLQPNGAAKVTK